ncbi:hypothetical protein ZWY2020_003557 [Hordeum vulgare]|nr:hypothetical protein ZWY2020_003557 [Hordeum vulgare]
MGADRAVDVLHDPDPTRPLLPLAVAKILCATLGMGADCTVHVLYDPDPARPLLPLAVVKILRTLALQESPDFLILGKQVRTPRPSQIRLNSVSFSPNPPCLSGVMIGHDLAYNLHSAFGNSFPGQSPSSSKQ